MNPDTLNKLEQRISLLEDERNIRNLVSSFADAVTRADYASVERLWAKDGTFHIHHPNTISCNGVEEIITLLKRLRSGKDFFVQFLHSGEVMIEKIAAEGRFIMHEVGMTKPDSFYNTYGFFSDKFRRQREGWVFTERVYDYMWLDKQPFNGDAISLPTLKPLLRK